VFTDQRKLLQPALLESCSHRDFTENEFIADQGRLAKTRGDKLGYGGLLSLS
jgi:hypothetical protein